jgi:ribosomal protein S18 acetylase RimI-like enzyme
MSALSQPDTRRIEVLDLRHFSAAQLRPLLRDEAERWQRRLHWDYTNASNVLLDYLDDRILPGFVALDAARGNCIVGYAFSVFEAAKAVIGDVYAFHETEALNNPVCEVLLRHMLEMLQSTPGVDRIESQLLMFPSGAFATQFHEYGFRSFPRLYMTCDLTQNSRHTNGNNRYLDLSPNGGHIDRPTPLDRHLDRPTGAERSLYLESPQNSIYTFQSWQPGFYDAAAQLIHNSYSGHMDSQINDQYQTVHGSQRFLHNIIRFPGCGTFDPDNSWVLRHPQTAELQGIVLCSRVRNDVGHITQLCVAPSLRGKGLGQALLRHCANQSAQRGIRSLSLTVTEANTGALRLYRDNGFTTLHQFEAMVWDKRGSRFSVQDRLHSKLADS